MAVQVYQVVVLVLRKSQPFTFSANSTITVNCDAGFVAPRTLGVTSTIVIDAQGDLIVPPGFGTSKSAFFLLF